MPPSSCVPSLLHQGGCVAFGVIPWRRIVSGSHLVAHLGSFAPAQIIACDGIWEVLSNKQVVVGVRKMLRDGHDVVTVCEALLDRCLAPSDTGVEYGRDNMSIILVVFHRGSSNIGVATSADSSSADGSSAASYGGASSSAGSSKASFRSLELLPEYSGSG